MLAPGTLLQDRYEIVRLIAEGGMGAVYLARDQRLDNLVALKETLFTDRRMSKAFEREARLLARLRHPALPRVSDHFIEENGQFLIMEYIPGEDLSQMLKRRAAPFPSDDVIRWADQLLDALEYLHSREPPVVHRDIKPQNLKLNERGQIILLDFGLAKNSSLQMTRLTSSGSIYGFTPNYAPMEQIQGAGTDPRSDLYSLSATLYHLVTGATPIDALTRAAAVVEGQPDPMSIASDMNGPVRPAVAAVVLKAMALSRNQRHSSAAEMRQAMNAACSLVDNANEETAVIGAPPRPVTPLSQEQPPAPVVLQPEAEKSDSEATILQEEAERQEDVQHLLSSGAAAFDAGEYAMAVGHWEAALKLSPNERGVKESIDSARRLIRKEQGRKARVERLVAEGTAAFDAKQYEAAIERWNEVLSLSSNEPGVEASIKAAQAALRKEARRQAKVKELVFEAANAFDVENYELAIQQWTKVLSLSPDEPGIKKSIEDASRKRRELFKVADEVTHEHGNVANPPRRSRSLHFQQSEAQKNWATHLLTRQQAKYLVIGAGTFVSVFAFVLLIGQLLFNQSHQGGSEGEAQATLGAQNAVPNSVVQPSAPVQSGSASSHPEKPLTSLPSGQPLIVTVEAATGDSWFKYQVDDSKPITMILKQGQSQDLPPAQTQVTLNYGNRTTLKFKINNRDATFPPDAPKFKSKVVISRDNFRAFFQ
jgi:serine/threonine protein kinase